MTFLLAWLVLSNLAVAADAERDLFRRAIAPLLVQHCLRCHEGQKAKGDIDLSSAANVVEGRGEGWLVVPGKPDESYLIEVVSGKKPAMPKAGDPLTQGEIAKLRQWIQQGAPWPDRLTLKADPLDWWSLRPLTRPKWPSLSSRDRDWVQTPIDAFVLAKLREKGMAPAPEADRRTLIRRLYFDLIGLPPTFEEVQQFARDPNPRAYEKLVERLLHSPQYGERWARHWLDVVHYGDTHGYDKDKVRPHAWPYRDYVINSLNEDKPYHQFVKEQLAGDAFFPDSPDGIRGLGFLACGPFDYVGHIEVKNGTMEKRRVRNIDRDDMVSVTMNTFVSLTAQCARCHDHKFDPISQEDYYSLQAVFAAVDRAERPYDADPQIARRRRKLEQARQELKARKRAIEEKIQKLAGIELATLDRKMAALTKKAAANPPPEFGYHSKIMPGPNHEKWVQIDLGRRVSIAKIIVFGAHDNFAGIGAGFGFPVRYRLEISDDPEFQKGVTPVVDKTSSDVKNPGVVPQSFELKSEPARYVRLTATKLAERKNDFIFAMAEMEVHNAEGKNVAAGRKVSARDSIEAPPRWAKTNLVDGLSPGSGAPEISAEMARLTKSRDRLLRRTVDAKTRQTGSQIEKALAENHEELKALSPPSLVYAAATEFPSQGHFVPTHGRPRPIFVLKRGDEESRLHEVGPGTVGCVPSLDSRFALSEDHSESKRRAALAEWIVHPRNPLTWRSIVNRIWQYHFGRGIVETPNDFGRMGAGPTHPELLDWLAVEFQGGGQSIKDLHRLIVNSATYRQSSADNPAHARIDAGNRFLWRMNRRRLEAEAVRDTVLAVSGKLRLKMGGPGFRPFRFENDHSPRYLYRQHDPDDPASHRRSIYRFIVRSVPDPFMTTLDCADPSLIVARRSETLTPLQALALLNNKLMVQMAEHFSKRVHAAERDTRSQVRRAWRMALQREPTEQELGALIPLAEKHGLANVCRLIFNTSEFLFID